MTRWWLAGATILFILNVLDLTTTFWALHRGAQELNPISKFLIDTHLLIPLKILVAGACLARAAFRNVRPWTPVVCICWWVTGIYSLTIVLNSLNILWA